MKEALKLALEALETCGEDEWHTDEDFGMMQIYDADKVTQAITAIKEALAQPAPEPERPWVGLTEEERNYIVLGIEVFGLSVTEILLEAEAKLKEKNT
jgi:hypothetical protein